MNIGRTHTDGAGPHGPFKTMNIHKLTYTHAHTHTHALTNKFTEQCTVQAGMSAILSDFSSTCYYVLYTNVRTFEIEKAKQRAIIFHLSVSF